MKTIDARTYRSIQKTLRDDLMTGPKSAVLAFVRQEHDAVSALRFLLYDHFRGQYGLQEFTKKLAPALETARNESDTALESYSAEYAEKYLKDGYERHVDIIMRAAIILREDKKEHNNSTA